MFAIIFFTVLLLGESFGFEIFDSSRPVHDISRLKLKKFSNDETWSMWDEWINQKGSGDNVGTTDSNSVDTDVFTTPKNVQVLSTTENGEDDDDRILNGFNVTENKYPFVVSIQKWLTEETVSRFCGGSILSPRWIISAAHCVMDRRDPVEEVIRINAGVIDSFDYLPPSQEVDVVEIIFHPDFGKTKQKHDDLALLRLKEALHFTDHVQPVPLPPNDFQVSVGSKGVIMGWGAIDVRELVTPELLQEANITVSPLEDCQKFFDTPLINRQLCLGLQDLTNACAGDSGGPFIQRYNSGQVLVGVTSFGADGCKARKPIIFTQITPYYDFIRDTIQQKTPDEPIPEMLLTTSL